MERLLLASNYSQIYPIVYFLMEIGWKSARGNLRETFEVMDTIYSIDDMENGIMKEIFD